MSADKHAPRASPARTDEVERSASAEVGTHLDTREVVEDLSRVVGEAVRDVAGRDADGEVGREVRVDLDVTVEATETSEATVDEGR